MEVERVRDATAGDLCAVGEIYNEGIEDGTATLDESPKSERGMQDWFAQHGGRFAVLVLERGQRIVGWASLNRYSQRCAHDGVADLSVYVGRSARGSGAGTMLLRAIELRARASGFHKIVLFALAHNAIGERLYRRMGYRDVGVFAAHGMVGDRFVDVAIKEKILGP